MTIKKDDLLQVMPRGPVSFWPARASDRSIPATTIYQHTGPRLTISVSKSNGQGTLTITVYDPAQTVDPTKRVQFYVIRADGTATLTSATSQPAAGVVEGDYTLTFALDPKHNIIVYPICTLLNGKVLRPGSETFNTDPRAQCVNVAVATNGTTAEVTANFDTDTTVGANGAQYSLDGGTTWNNLTVDPSAFTAQFSVTMLENQTQNVLVRGMAVGNVAGPSILLQIPSYVSTVEPALTVTATPGATAYSIAYTSGGGTVTYTTDGGTTWNPVPASPFSINRNPLGGADIVVTIREVNGSATVTDSVTIPAIGSTAAPVVDLDVTVASVSPTQVVFNVTVSNPNAGGTAGIIIDGSNCTFVWQGVNYTNATATTTPWTGTAQLTVDRPAFASPTAAVRFRATMQGGVAETIARTIPNQDKTAFGPSLEFDVTSDASNYYITPTSANGATLVYLVNNGLATACTSGTQLTFARPGYKLPANIVTFKATLDGQTISNSIAVPALDTSGDTLGITRCFAVLASNTLEIDWSASAGWPSGCTFNVAYSLKDGSSGNVEGLAGTTSSYTFTGVTFGTNTFVDATLDIVLNGTLLYTTRRHAVYVT